MPSFYLIGLINESFIFHLLDKVRIVNISFSHVIQQISDIFQWQFVLCFILHVLDVLYV